MSLQTSGRIKLSEIASEFGGSGPHKLSEYYRGGSNVKDAGLNTNAGIPTSGTIKIKNFYNSGNPYLTELNGGEAYGTSGNFDVTVTLDTTNRGIHTNIIILYLGNSANQGSSITFSIAGHTVVENVQRLNNVSDDGSGCGMFTAAVGDVSSITITSTGGVSGKGMYVLQYDNVLNLTGTRDSDTPAQASTSIDLNFGKATFAAALWANAFSDDYYSNTFGDITSSGGETVTQKNLAVKTVGYLTKYDSSTNFDRTFTVGGTPRRTYVPRSIAGATVNI